MRIMLIVYSLGRGGAERVMTAVANHWCAAGHEVTIVTLLSTRGSTYPLRDKVRVLCLQAGGASGNALYAIVNNLGRFLKLRRVIRSESPDVIMSFMGRVNVLTLIASWNLDSKVIVSERNDPRCEPFPIAWRCLRRMTYGLAKYIVVQTESIRAWYAGINAQWPCVVIPNPIGEEFTAVASRKTWSYEQYGMPADALILIGVGRLCPQKGFDLLIPAFAACAAARPQWHLLIMGEGRERDRLLGLARHRGIAERVHLIGESVAPRTVMESVHLFVLSSRYEGFPNVLLEAMSCGLSVVSFACRSGPGDIITDGYDGLLVRNVDVDSLSVALSKLMDSETLRNRLGKNARESVRRYWPAKIFEKWDKLLADLDHCTASS